VFPPTFHGVSSGHACQAFGVAARALEYLSKFRLLSSINPCDNGLNSTPPCRNTQSSALTHREGLVTMAPITPFSAADITEKARRDLLLLLEGVR
jgi:hypothetical protein